MALTTSSTPVSATRLAQLVQQQLAGAGLARPAYASLGAVIRTLAVDGRVGAAVRLPSERDLAVALGVSRTTVTRAYAALVDQGWARAQRGAGTFLRIPGRVPHAASPLVPDADVAFDLTAAAVRCVPGTAALVERASADLPALLRGPGYEPVGLLRLREVVAAGYVRRGLPTSPDQIVVTTGAMAAIALVVRTTTTRGDRLLVENPTYASVLPAARGAGLRVTGVGVDGVGEDEVGEDRGAFDAEAFRAAVRAGGARLAYLVPDFHNPTGRLLTDADRAAAAEVLADGPAVIVDEALVDLDLDLGPAGSPLPLPFAAHLPGAFSVGSVSKPLWGGVRVGWVRCPADRVSEVRAARLTLDLGASALDQLVAARFLEEPGDLLEHRLTGLRRMRSLWLDALDDPDGLPGWTARSPGGGLALWVRLPAGLAPELAGAARTRGVALAVGPQFTADGSARDRVRIPLTADVDDLTDVVGRLRESWAEVLEQGPSARAKTAAPLIA